MAKELKVLVVDDTVTDRQMLSKILLDFPSVELLGSASNGKIALTKIGLNQPDLIFLDLIMPEMDGLETLSKIRELFPNVDVIIVSGIDQENAKMTMQALEKGALDFIAKPRGASAAESLRELKSTLSRIIPIAKTRKYSRQVRNISEIRLRPAEPQKKFDPITEPIPPKVEIVRTPSPKPPVRNRTKEKKPVSLSPVQPRKPGSIHIVAIGVSTGGPNALQEMVPKLEHDFPVPIVVVQHMPPMFTASLAVRLNKESKISVSEGEDGQALENGHMYIAPGGRHMVIRKKQAEYYIGLIDSPPVNSCRPAVDVMLRSLCMAYGGNVLTVILTGMGNDGASGVSAIRRKGGYSLVQDEKSAVVWGMPGSVVEAGQADEIVNIDKMADRISEIVRGRDS